MGDLDAASRRTHAERVMGTVASFSLRGGGDHGAAIRAASAWLHEVDARFSTYRADSEVSRLARGELTPADRSPELAEVIAACDAMTAQSGGAFSARRSGGFDPSAFVKGWAVDRAGAILRAHGCSDWSINAGGDVLVSSSPRQPMAPWRVGVQHPFEREALALVLQARDLAVATSGRYERGDHIQDPRTGEAATGTASVTVCGPELGSADAISTAALVLGDDGPAWVAGIDGYECWTVFDDGRVLATDGFPRSVHGVPLSIGRRSDVLAVAS